MDLCGDPVFHPADEDLSVGTPVFHPADEDLSVGTPVCTRRGVRAFSGRCDVGAEGVERIVGDEAAPDEAPEGVDGLAGIAASDGLVERIEEAGAGGFENGEKLFFALGERVCKGALRR